MTTLTSVTAVPGRSSANGRGLQRGVRIPLIHITDLYQPPQDPDDHLDLAAIMALPEYDLRGVVLDATRKFFINLPEGWDVPRDPGYVAVAQLSYLTGCAIPAAMGPIDPLAHPGDAALDRPRSEQGGINLLLEALDRSTEPVTISVVGSGRVLAAAFNREPELLKAKTRAVLLNAGATGGPKREWNVELDRAAYVALWRSGLPIQWYPCGTDSGAFDPAHERGTFWKTSHAVLLRNLPDGLRAWICYAFSGSARGDIIRALAEMGRGAVWEHVLAGERNMWTTVSLAMGAGRSLARTAAGWRFVPAETAGDQEQWPFRLDPIRAMADEEARVVWEVIEEPSLHHLFARKPGLEYGVAMAEATNALLCGISV